MPSVVSLCVSFFFGCSKLKHLDLGENVMDVSGSIFNKGKAYGGDALEELIIRSPQVLPTKLKLIESSPLMLGTGYIYVPASVIEDYRTSSYWSTYASQFRAIEDYPEICGTTE
jgi:hypothetical protein